MTIYLLALANPSGVESLRLRLRELTILIPNIQILSYPNRVVPCSVNIRRFQSHPVFSFRATGQLPFQPTTLNMHFTLVTICSSFMEVAHAARIVFPSVTNQDALWTVMSMHMSATATAPCFPVHLFGLADGRNFRFLFDLTYTSSILDPSPDTPVQRSTDCLLSVNAGLYTVSSLKTWRYSQLAEWA